MSNAQAADVRALSDELLRVARRGPDRCFQTVGKYGPIDLPHITQVMTALYPDELADGPGERLLRCLSDGIRGLPEELIPDTQVEWRWAGETLFGLTDFDVTHLDGKRYDNLLAAIMERAELHKGDRNTSRDVSTAVRDRLARDLLRLLAMAQTAGQVGSATDYIPRLGPEELVRGLLLRNERAVFIHGDAGTGKSRLAAEIAASVAASPDDVLIVQADEDEQMLSTLAAHLETITGAPISGSGLSDLRLKFARALTEPTGKIVVFDNVPDARSLRLLLPRLVQRRLQTTVIVTSQGVVGETSSATVPVDNMSDTEARDMVKVRIPGISDEDADLLGRELDGRPLAIDHAAALMNMLPGELSASAFCEVLRADVVELLDAVPSETKLTAIYRRLLDTMRSDDAYNAALRVLEMMMFMGYHVPIEVIDRTWESDQSDASGTARRLMDRLLVRSAVSMLARGSVVEVRDANGKPWVIRMHRLTHQILQSLWSEPYDRSVGHFIRSYGAYLDEIAWLPGAALTESCELIHFFSPLLDLIDDDADVASIMATPDRRSLARVLAAAISHSLQRGIGEAKFVEMANAVLDSASAEEKADAPMQTLAVALVRSGESSVRAVSASEGPRQGAYAAATLSSLFDPLASEDRYSLVETESTLKKRRIVDLDREIFGSTYPADAWEARLRLASAARSLEACHWDNLSDHLENVWTTASALEPEFGSELQAECLRRAFRGIIRSARDSELQTWLARTREYASARSPIAMNWALPTLVSASIQAARFHVAMRAKVGAPFDDISADAIALWESTEKYSKEMTRRHQVQLHRLLRADGIPAHMFLSPCVAKAVNEETHVHANLKEFHNVGCVSYEISIYKNLVPHYHAHQEKRDGKFSRSSLDGSAKAYVRSMVPRRRGDRPRTRWTPYHDADAALLAYAVAKWAGVAERTVRVTRERAHELLVQIGREDRLAIGDRIGDHDIEFAWLGVG